jgi:hypothetical protein
LFRDALCLSFVRALCLSFVRSGGASSILTCLFSCVVLFECCHWGFINLKPSTARALCLTIHGAHIVNLVEEVSCG